MTNPPQHLPNDLLNAYVDGRVNATERKEIRGHLETCAECRQELNELRATVRLLNGLPVYRPRRSFQLSAAQFGTTAKPTGIIQFLPVVRSLSIAAVIAFLVIGGAQALDVASDNDDGPNSSLDVARNDSEASGETDEASGASQNAEDAPTNGTLIDRGSAASAQDEALANLPAAAADEAADTQQSTATDRDGGDGPLAIAALVTGVLALSLVAVWIAMIRFRRYS